MNANQSDAVKLIATTEGSISPKEEDSIVTLVVLVIGIIGAIIFLFSMGIFLDCKHQKEVKLKMPPNSRTRKTVKLEDMKSLGIEMCPSGASEIGYF